MEVRKVCETCGCLEDQENDDRQPVEHVVDGGAGESQSELLPIVDLGHCHQSVGHGGADVGAHDYRDGGADRGKV